MLNQIWVTCIMFQLISVENAVELINYGAKKGNLEGPCLSLSRVNKKGICGSYLQPMETAGSSQVDVLLNTKAKVNI